MRWLTNFYDFRFKWTANINKQTTNQKHSTTTEDIIPKQEQQHIKRLMLRYTRYMQSGQNTQEQSNSSKKKTHFPHEKHRKKNHLIYIYKRCIRWVSRLFSYGHFYWDYTHETLLPFEVIYSMYLLYRSNNIFKAPWKSSFVSESMTFVTASFISSIVI